jgi:hypothetical protein
MPTVVDNEKRVFILVLFDEAQDFVIELAMRVMGGNEELIGCEPVQVTEDPSQLVKFPLDLEFVLVPSYQQDLNLAIPRVCRVRKCSICGL